MPNWGYTDIRIKHPDLNKLQQLSDLLKTWTSSNARTNDFGTNWLGNIVLHSGIGTVDTGDPTDVRCRGILYWQDLDEAGHELCLDVKSAWVPCVRLWKLVCDKYLPDAEVVFIGYEPGCEIYMTNDKEKAGKYWIDPYDCEWVEENMEASEEEAVKVLQDLVGSTEMDLDTLLELMYQTADDKDKIGVHQWEYVPILNSVNTEV